MFILTVRVKSPRHYPLKVALEIDQFKIDTLENFSSKIYLKKQTME